MALKSARRSPADEVIFPCAYSNGGFVQVRTARSVRTVDDVLHQPFDNFEVEETTKKEIARSMAMGRFHA